jgi:hypothetical protein
MMADGLTKTLGQQPFSHFIKLIGIENIYKKLEAIRKEDELSSGQSNISTIAFVTNSVTWDAREIRSAMFEAS